MARQPDGPPPPPTVQKLRIRYAKRGRLRFASHRDLARTLERALRRASVPMAFSAGFSPHPKISYLGAAPTGAASEAEYLEIGLSVRCDPEAVRAALDAALPEDVAVLDCVEAGEGTGSLADRIDTSVWRVELPGVSLAELEPAVEKFLASDVVTVAKRTKNGLRDIDAREAVTSASAAEGAGCAILHMVVRQLTPAVRPDDVLAALAAVADLHPPLPPRAVREAQGRLDDSGDVADPLGPDRAVRSCCQEERAQV
jgi:radical SAM-linked protein